MRGMGVFREMMRGFGRGIGFFVGFGFGFRVAVGCGLGVLDGFAVAVAVATAVAVGVGVIVGCAVAVAFFVGTGVGDGLGSGIFLMLSGIDSFGLGDSGLGSGSVMTGAGGACCKLTKVTISRGLRCSFSMHPRIKGIKIKSKIMQECTIALTLKDVLNVLSILRTNRCLHG